MSRIGRSPIPLDKKLQIELKPENFVVIKKSQGEETFKLPSFLSAEIKEDQLFVTRKGDTRKERSAHGLYRSLIFNAIVGETKGWEKKLQLNGVGYKASVSGKSLTLNLGYSHSLELKIPETLTVKVIKNTSILIQGQNKEKVGTFADRIRSYRPPEPFLGKGVKYEGEFIARKTGKSSVKGK